MDEEELSAAILHLLEKEKTVAEGAGAAALAAVMHARIKASGPVAVLVSGGNIDVNVLARIIERGLVKDGRLVRLRVGVGDHPGELHRLLGIVAHERANIMEIEHSRAFSKVDLDQTVVVLTLETRGPEHVHVLEVALSGGGYSFERI